MLGATEQEKIKFCKSVSSRLQQQGQHPNHATLQSIADALLLTTRLQNLYHPLLLMWNKENLYK